MRKKRRHITIEYLCTERRPISLIVAVLSFIAAAAYLVYACVCAFGIDNVKDAVKGLWGFKYVANVGLYTLFSVLGIVLFFVLGLYRGLMGYFYLKTYKGDPSFYKARRWDTILFSGLSLVMSAVYFAVYSSEGFSLPFMSDGVTLCAAVLYLLFCALPLLERLICFFWAKTSGRTFEDVPTKEDIAEELEADAEMSVRTAGVDCSDLPLSDGKKSGEKTTGEKSTSEKTTSEKFGNAAVKSHSEKKSGDKPSGGVSRREEERITRDYGKAAGRLARKFKEVDDDDD